MAAVSGSRTSIVTTNSSSSAQFQLAQSSNNATAPNATKSAPLATSNNKPPPDSIAQSSRPAPVQAMSRPSTTPSGSGGKHGTPSTIRFGTPELGELTSNPLLESVLRPNKDGRVKNPVPSKLKGKTDIKKGNFSVMHMGTNAGKRNDAGRDAAAERDAAARRTSENTASRAKAAQQEKYVPPRRRGLEAESSPAVKVGSPFAPSMDQKQRARPLAPDETKFEQARLLTLLRSINPITVVDQICKAVAYFGGIPGAPPPEDGIFPESASTKETGALFIGWLSEIFPDLSSHGGHPMLDTPGSQSRLSIGAIPPMNASPNPSNGFGYGQAVSAPVWGLSPALPATKSHIPSISPETAQPSNAAPAKTNPPELPRQETPAKQVPEAAPAPTSTSKRGRGRPKGSRNKGKTDVQNAVQAGVSILSAGPDTPSMIRPVVPEPSHDSPVSTAGGAPGKGTQTGAPQIQSGSDQPAGKKQAVRYTEPTWKINLQKPQAEPTSSAVPATVDELSPEERAVLEAFRQQDASEAGKASTPNSAAVQAAGLKRKRPTPKPKGVAAPANQALIQPEQTQSTPQMSTLNSSNNGSMSITGRTLDWSSVDTSTPTAPAAKRQRQRKPKAPGGNEPPRSQTTSVASNTTPPIPPHALPESTTTSSQQVPPSRPPAEGLEAHYEKFASRPQQNGTTHTPSTAQQQQQQQQQLRQQQKPTSVVPQQKQVSAPQQQQKPVAQMQAAQMQQQKSQQGGQRDDQKVAQGSSARPSSTGFYNQRNHGSFGQYQANQTSQLYKTHQASSQIGSGSNNSNSFRAANAHGLGQASPQFSQADVYRTASPRAISQASPTFSQADTSFRSASSHGGMSQQSPTYAQAEKIYRAANSQPITQPTSSFPRAHNQAQQQSHQNHYTHFAENPYADLPTLDTLSGHSTSSGHPAVNLNSGSFGQPPSSRASTSSLFGTTSPSVFDPASSADQQQQQQQQQQLLRAAAASSRPQASSGVYGTSSNLSSSFEPGAGDQELRERLMRNIGRR